MVCLGNSDAASPLRQGGGTFCPLPVLGLLLYFSKFGWGWPPFKAISFQAEEWDCDKELLQSKETLRLMPQLELIVTGTAFLTTVRVRSSFLSFLGSFYHGV